MAYWRRRVAQACIYGVDLNPLAVELAKLSLWLATVSKDKPLSFLDHHLRCGNSLIGARVADLPLGAAPPPKSPSRSRQRQQQQAQAAGQMSMLDDSAFAGSMRAASRFMGDIERLGSETLADVQESERIYVETVRQTTERARLLADLWTARHFGLKIADDLWQGLANYVLHGGFALPGWEELLAQGQQIAAERRFLHWELEFPEVFFDQHGRLRGEAAGFDAVIGNPPYVHSGQISAIKPYLAQAHAAVYDGTADLYVYFYHQGVRLLRSGGRMSYIVTNKWLRAGYGEALRGFFASSVMVDQIIDFGHAPIFPDADVFPCIVVVRRASDDTSASAEPRTRICVFPREELGKISLDLFIQSHSYDVPANRFGRTAWSLERAEVDALMEKLRRNGTPLHEYIGANPLYGIKTGFNEAFLVDMARRNALVAQDPGCADLLRPYLRGQDVKRWLPQWADLWMIVLKSSENVHWPWSDSAETAEGVFAQTYPSIFRHMKAYEQRLRDRQDQGRYWWELRSCTYYEVFERPKIVHTDIAWRPQFALAREPMYLVNTAYIWPTDDLYLLAVINSPLLWSYMWRNAMHGKDEALRLIYTFVHTLPIAPPRDDVRADAESLVSRLIILTSNLDDSRSAVLEWLRLEFQIDAPGQSLAQFWTLDADSFLREVKRRRPRAAARLSPAPLRELQQTFQEYAPLIRGLKTESEQLEHRLSDLVNEAYGLTPDEVALLWETAPPRMPVGL